MPAVETAAERLYEGMFLLDSGKFATDPDGATGQVLDILAKAGATVVAHRPWQDGRLAYEIEGHKKGLHYLVYFRMPGTGVEEIHRLCKLNEIVLRELIIQHEQKLFDAMVTALGSEGQADDAPEEAASGSDEPGSDPGSDE